MSSRWLKSIERFVQEHTSDGTSTSSIDNDKKDILFVVNPACGGGTAMKLYEQCMGELKATGRAVEVYFTKGTDDVLTLSKTKDLNSYKAFVLLSGDSTLAELCQQSLRKKGKWPFAPILLLPGGTSNVVANENFGYHANPTHVLKQIIRQTLCMSSTATVFNNMETKEASVLKVSSDDVTEEPRFALQIWMGGNMLQSIIDFAERRRADVYAILGQAGLIISLLAYLPFSPTDGDPTVLSILNSDTEAMGNNCGFGVNRFDNQMSVVHVASHNNPGKWEICKNILGKTFNGQLAQEWKEKKLSDYVHVETASKFVYKPTMAPIKFYSDGSSTCAFHVKDKFHKVYFETTPHAIPMIALQNKELLVRNAETEENWWDIQVMMPLPNCRSTQDAYKHLACPSGYSTWNRMEFVEKTTVEIPQGTAEPLQKSDSFTMTFKAPIKASVTVVESSCTDTECIFALKCSTLRGMMQNATRQGVFQNKNDGVKFWGFSQERFVSGRWMANGDSHIRLQHEKFLCGLNEALAVDK